MSTENLPAEQKTQLPEGTVTVLFTDLVPCDLVFVSQYHGFESVFGAEYSYGMGYGLTSAEFPIGPRSAAWGGSGGSICLMDQDTKLTFCYLMNKMAPRDDARGTNLLLAASLGVL